MIFTLNFSKTLSNSQVWSVDYVLWIRPGWSWSFTEDAREVQVGHRRDHTVFAETRSEMCWGTCPMFNVSSNLYASIFFWQQSPNVTGSWVPVGRRTRLSERSGARENEENDIVCQGQTITYSTTLAFLTNLAGGTSVFSTRGATVSRNKSCWSCASVPDPALTGDFEIDNNERWCWDATRLELQHIWAMPTHRPGLVTSMQASSIRHEIESSRGNTDR